ncbi:MAG: alcohol dehydrogenase catalytic domain-containing protein, partial [Clostridia bacterium]|nr:alcohol dehydrogenase catalytic domain-containing protein [Clostridia bacterium]
EKVGEAVPDIIRPGMTVTVNPYTACGKCPSCRNGRAPMPWSPHIAISQSIAISSSLQPAFCHAFTSGQ